MLVTSECLSLVVLCSLKCHNAHAPGGTAIQLDRQLVQSTLHVFSFFAEPRKRLMRAGSAADERFE